MTAGTNQFVPFATGTGANVYSAAAYSGLPARATGVVGGVANSATANNAWRQGTSMSAMLGQFISAHGYDALDDGDIATLKAHFEAALSDVIADAVPSPDLSPYLLKAGGTLTGSGHISDPVNPSHVDHLVRLGYLLAALADLPTVDLSPYLAKAGGTLTGSGHISDPVNPSHADHLVRRGYVDGLVLPAPRAVGSYVYNHYHGVTIAVATTAASLEAIGVAGYGTWRLMSDQVDPTDSFQHYHLWQRIL